MAGWSYTGASWGDPASDCITAAIYNQFVDAIKERQDAAEITPTYNPVLVSAGDDAQDVAKWNILQNALAELVAQFVDTGEASGGNFDNYALETIPLYTLGNWRDEIGLTGAGFRRVAGANWPADWTSHADPAYSHGNAQAGDLFGPWIFRDLQDGLNLLVWTKRETAGNPITTCKWTNDGTYNHERATGGDNYSWAAAYGEAEAYWGSHTAPYSFTYQTDYQAPCATYEGSYIPDPEYWEARILHIEAKISMANVPETLNGSARKRDVDFYCYANFDPGNEIWVWVWDANGEDVIELQQSLFDTKPAQTGTTIKSDFLGDSDAQPNRCQDPESLGGSGSAEPQTARGYYGAGSKNPWRDPGLGIVSGGTAVIRWDVAEGFDYY